MKTRIRKQMIVVFFCVMFSCAIALASGGGGEHGEKPVKGWTATDNYRVMNFVVLIGALVFLLRKPVAEGLRGRIDSIRNQLSELEEKKNDAEKQMKESDNRLKGLEKEAEQIIEEYIKQGEVAKSQILKDTQKMGEKIKEQASNAIALEYNLARRALIDDIFENATLLAKQIIEQNIKPDDHERLIGEYIEKVVAQ